MITRSVAHVMENTLLIWGFRRTPEHQKEVLSYEQGFFVRYEKSGLGVSLSMNSDTSWRVVLQRYPQKTPSGPTVFFSHVNCSAEQDAMFTENAVMAFLRDIKGL